MAAKQYVIYHAPPVSHWYQKRVGWFGKSFVVFLLLGFVGYTSSVYMVVRTDVKSLTSETANTQKPHKVTATPLAETSAENIVDLQTVIDRWVAEHPGLNWGVSVKSIDGPSFEASHNADQKFESASIYKLFLVLPLFAEIPVEHQSRIMLNVQGQQRSIATCVDLMLRLSHNECGEAIGDYLDWTKAQKTLNSAGFTHTVFGTSGLRSSPRDAAMFLEKLQGDMLTRTGKEVVLKSLREQRWRDGIPAGCPGCTTANKTGSNSGAVHDAGLVRYSSGTYALAIFSENGSFGEIAELTGRIQQKILDTTL